ncbi:class I SAM-dependent methyltransferase [Alteraurantiacibacter aquimixticola]|uniref:Class I SAM-dependent methyltransferase n=1 Tax=Alteraurantiacibacter aquimixticola TaxID=2489173 RepID=A0A4V6UGB1_9SPHN|nr:class I SAM-dependent methyltransferase [Alteraurantiacibacter aquimixticola]TIX50373.1 class I SAM-dependent methyltransferase [Alteraurantiacibacter aquimixticola]
MNRQAFLHSPSHVTTYHAREITMANANAPTARMLDDAGIAPGMRVLDVGCAMGVLTRELAQRVGPGGEVVGIDIDRERVEMARGEVAPAGAAPIHYAVADLSQNLPDLGTFDAVVGRRVLMYLPDPEPALAQLAALLRPGGVMAWQEHDGAGRPFSIVELPRHVELANWIWATIASEGGLPGTALQLPRLLQDCGLEPASFRAEAIVLDPEGKGGASAMARMMLPRIFAAGVVAEEGLDSEAFIAALDAEKAKAAAPIIWDFAYMTVARKPA